MIHKVLTVLMTFFLGLNTMVFSSDHVTLEAAKKSENDILETKYNRFSGQDANQENYQKTVERYKPTSSSITIDIALQLIDKEHVTINVLMELMRKLKDGKLKARVVETLIRLQANESNHEAIGFF